MINLDFKRLHALLDSVFALKRSEAFLTLIVDLPNAKLMDNPAWTDRRQIAGEWYSTLSDRIDELPFPAVLLCTYENVGSNNNDLPRQITVARCSGDCTYAPGEMVPLGHILKASSIVLAPTELSATAPLKNLARTLRFRGATLPGFTREMIPALMLNYEDVHKRVKELESRLSRAVTSYIEFQAGASRYSLEIDLRHRSAHASSGLIREAGTVANLPSGEAYIVPYEGERPGDPSTTNGQLPVQFGEEIVVYRVEGNKAAEVLTSGELSEQERLKLREEPAYGNIGELGLGVLGEWGMKAMGSILLDEKLGLHIAFGRSEHFGGFTGPDSFRSPQNVVHIDRVYVSGCQPWISVPRVSLAYASGKDEVIMRSGKYTI